MLIVLFGRFPLDAEASSSVRYLREPVKSFSVSFTVGISSFKAFKVTTTSMCRYSVVILFVSRSAWSKSAASLLEETVRREIVDRRVFWSAYFVNIDTCIRGRAFSAVFDTRERHTGPRHPGGLITSLLPSRFTTLHAVCCKPNFKFILTQEMT
jgi:hypothetical protein